MPLGFLLHPTYRIEDGGPVVHLFGKLETGESFVVRDRRSRPHFFVPFSDMDRARLAVSGGRFEADLSPTDFRSMAGDRAVRVTMSNPGDIPGVRQCLAAQGITCYEADIPFTTRFLIDHGLRGSMRIEGNSHAGRLVGRVFEDPVMTPADWTPTLTSLSIDIETDPDAKRIYAIGLWAPGIEEVHFARVPEHDSVPIPAAAIPYPDEAACLRGFLASLKRIDPDVLLGWNLIDFDLSVLEARFRAHRIDFYIGRAEMPCAIRSDRTFWGASRASIPGRVALDGVALLRGAFVRLDDYRLDTAARVILGERKAYTGHGRADWIEATYRDDLHGFVGYNLTDARLAYQIVDKLGLVPLSIRRSLLTGMPLDRVGASIASFDFLYLHELRKRGIVAPSVDAETEAEPTVGGYVLEGEPGLYQNILVFDFRSLYPSIILTFGLDPLSYAADPSPEEASQMVRAPNGAHFRRGAGILPQILARLLPEREAAKARGDEAGSTAIKILMNSFYGVLGTPRCRFYSPATTNAITSLGHAILLWTKKWIEDRGHRVLYGDTDSLFVASGRDTPEDAAAAGRALAADANDAISSWIGSGWGVESRLHLRFDRLYERFFLPGLRHSREGSKKRYAGLVRRKDGREEIVFTGLESARRDWTDLSKEFQREILGRAFHDEPVDGFIRAFIRQVRDGERDSQLVYRKALRKDPTAYTKTTPPHVKAARQMEERGSRLVSYIVTTAGPEPADAPEHPPDYDHYVERQIRPIAEAVLSCLGSTWEQVMSGQGDLFD
jgi:DNA polymerase II